MNLTQDLVSRIIQRGIEAGQKRGFSVAVAVVDESGRLRGVLRHEDALWVSTLDHVYKIDVSKVGAERIVADLPTQSNSNHFFGIAPNGK